MSARGSNGTCCAPLALGFTPLSPWSSKHFAFLDRNATRDVTLAWKEWLTRPGRPREQETLRAGDLESKRDLKSKRPGEQERPEEQETWRARDLESERPGEQETWRARDLRIKKLEDQET
jgi:hypothetical protein